MDFSPWRQGHPLMPYIRQRKKGTLTTHVSLFVWKADEWRNVERVKSVKLFIVFVIFTALTVRFHKNRKKAGSFRKKS